MHSSRFRAGDWVEVLSKEEILATLDHRGQLEGLPFMPEMFELCGKRFKVFKRAHKTCDPPSGLRGRRMANAVHLDGVRCDGHAHGGCQARCLLFWKDAWLRSVEEVAHRPSPQKLEPRPSIAAPPTNPSGCREEDVWAWTLNPESSPENDPVFVCQSTQLPFATRVISRWDVRQYLEDYASGNAPLSQLAGSFVAFVFHKLVIAGVGLGLPLRLVYDAFQKLRRGTPYPWRAGRIPKGSATPAARLDLQPGEWVRIRSQKDILATINEEGLNRGMSFDPEMVPYCGGTFRVLERVSQIIDERTGKMHHLKNDCIMLDEVVCRACYAAYRRFCPRSIHSYWRESWLERAVPVPTVLDPVAANDPRCAAIPGNLGDLARSGAHMANPAAIICCGDDDRGGHTPQEPCGTASARDPRPGSARKGASDLCLH